MAAPETVKVYTLNGSTQVFPVSFEYLARKFVQVTLIGDTRRVLNFMTEFVFHSATAIRTLGVWGTAQGFRQIEVRRVTSATERLVNFNDASILRASDLNLAEVQTIHIAQEARDLAADTLGADDFGNLDARGRRIVNVSPPVASNDAMTLGYYNTDRNGLLVFKDQTEAFKNQAAQSAADAANDKTITASYKEQAALAATGAQADKNITYNFMITTKDYRDQAEAFRNQAGSNAVSAAQSAANAAAAAAPATELVNKVDSSVATANAAAATANAASTQAQQAAAAVANKQDKLGFTPVRQDGANQITFRWWADAKMRAYVDGTDLGPLAFADRENTWPRVQSLQAVVLTNHGGDEKVKNVTAAGGDLGGWGANVTNPLMVLNAARNAWVFSVDQTGGAAFTGTVTAAGLTSAKDAFVARDINVGGLTASTHFQLKAGGRFYLTSANGRNRRIEMDVNSGIISFVNLAENSSVGQLSDDGIWYGSNFVMGSDGRLKDSWRPLGDSFVERLADVKAGSYRLKATGNRHVGVEAQSLAKVMPEAVTPNQEGILHVDVGSAAMAAVVYLARKVRELEATIKGLVGAK